MPESEPKPKLIELVAPGAGQGWKAVLKNGKAVVIHEINAPAAEATAAVPRIQRLAEHRHPALAPVLAWGTETNGIWVAVEPNEGTPLGTILSRGPLTPPAAAALGAALLSGVAALHEAGIAMGGFGASAVRVTGNGEVRLSGHPAAAVRGAPSQSDLRADVRSCGMAICAAFGVDPAGAPAPPSIPPGLVVTMRSMASGAMGPAADRAQGALREMASALLAPDRSTAAQSELALRAGGREMPSITPFLPKETYPPAPAPAPAPLPQEPQAPPPFVRPAADETPVRPPASYEPPARQADTYPPMAAPPPYVPPPRPEEPAPSTPASYEPRPRDPATFPVVTPPIEAPPVPRPPVPTWDAPPAASSPAVTEPEPAASTWDSPPPPAAAPTPPMPPTPPAAPAPSTWEPAPAAEAWAPAAAASTPSEAPPAPAAPPAPVSPEPAPTDTRATWTAVPTPAWDSPAETDATTAPTPPVPAVPAYVVPSAVASTPDVSVTRTPAPAPIYAPAASPSAPARKPPAPRRPAYQMPTERPPWLVPAIAGALIVLLLIVGGGYFLTHRGTSSNNTATASPKTSPKTSPKASPNVSPSPTTALLPVPTYAPLTSDPITKVQFCLPEATCPGGTSADTKCTLNGTCRVDMGFYWTGVHAIPKLSYVVEFFDRCANQSKVVFQKSDNTDNHVSWIPAPNGGFPVTLPGGVKAGAIVAVATTDKGVTAASAPYDLPGSAASCA